MTADRNLDGDELAAAREGACPDCGSGPLLNGPRGGMSINRYCPNPACGSWFNFWGPLGELGVERIGVRAERVLLVVGERSIEADVVLRSANGRSMALSFDGAIDMTPRATAVGMVMLLQAVDGTWTEIVTGMPVEIRSLPSSGENGP